MIIVYIPCKDKEEAKKISKQLVNKRLIACANIWPVNSIYKWKGKLHEEMEVVILAKSVKQKEKEIINEVKRIHSYDLPCIEITESRANKEYEQWVKGQVI